jgi:hypothetical protein
MEYILLFFFGWMVVCSPAIIVTAVANSRRRRETAELNDKIASLTRQLDALERRIRVDAPHVPAPAVHAVPAMKISEEETRAAVRPVVSPAHEHRPPRPEEPAPWVSAPPPPPLVAPAPSAPSPAAQTHQAPPQPKPVDVGGIPMTPPQRPVPTAEPPRAVVPPPPPKAPPVPIPPPAVAATPPKQPVAASVPALPVMASSSAQVRASAGSLGLSTIHTAYDIQPTAKSSVSLEEKFGKWLLRFGIAAVVIGVGFLVSQAWGHFGPWMRVLILYASALSTLAAGIFAERKERYQTLGRALIGGGWAITVLVISTTFTGCIRSLVCRRHELRSRTTRSACC